MKRLVAQGRWGASDAHRSKDEVPKPKILLVEDDLECRNLAVRRLMRVYEVLVASNDKEACALYRIHAGSLYLILLDIQLQGSTLDGMNLCELFRTGTCGVEIPPHARDLPAKSIPIVFMTAHGAQYGHGNLTKVGGNRVIEKPVDFVRLAFVLSQLHEDISKKAFDVL